MSISHIAHAKNSYEKNIALLFDPIYLESLRQQMVKFVLLQTSSIDEAEDIVQEALLGALKYVERFQGKSALKTWVFAILKNKMIDYFRKKSRTSTFSELAEIEDDAENEITSTLVQAFDQSGHWANTAQSSIWQSPDMMVENEDFWLIFDACLNGLPAKNAQVFMFREIMDLKTEEICQQLNLSVSNFNIIMYRSRMQLRKCLENTYLLDELG